MIGKLVIITVNTSRISASHVQSETGCFLGEIAHFVLYYANFGTRSLRKHLEKSGVLLWPMDDNEADDSLESGAGQWIRHVLLRGTIS